MLTEQYLVEAAEAALKEHDEWLPSKDFESDQERLVNALTSLRHWADAMGASFPDACRASAVYHKQDN